MALSLLFLSRTVEASGYGGIKSPGKVLKAHFFFSVTSVVCSQQPASNPLQGYLTYKKTHPPSTIP